MKKIWNILLVMVLLISFSGCDDNNNNDNIDDKAKEEEKIKLTSFKVQDYTLNFGDYEASFAPGVQEYFKGKLVLFDDYTFTVATEGYSDIDINLESGNYKGTFEVKDRVVEESGIAFPNLVFTLDNKKDTFSLRVEGDNLLGDEWHQYKFSE